MMIVPEELITEIIESKLKSIKNNIDIIDSIFPSTTTSNRKRLKEFIAKDGIKVLRGYPRNIAQIPAYVLTLGGEREIEESLGSFIVDEGAIEYKDELEYEVITSRDKMLLIQVAKKPITKVYAISINGVDYDESYFEVLDNKRGLIRLVDSLRGTVNVDDEALVQYEHGETGNELEGTRINAQFRIEVWTTNGDLTVLLYHLLKYIILSSRNRFNDFQMLQQTLGGTDFEPLNFDPEYVYRRCLSFEFSYEVVYDNNYSFVSYIDVEPKYNFKNDDRFKI